MTGVDMAMTKSHCQIWTKTNAPVDEGVRGIVSALSAFPCLETIESCEGTNDRPAWCCFRYGAYWEQPWRDLAEFVLDWLGPTLAKEVGDSANIRIQVTASGLIMGELSVRPGQARAVETCLRRLARSVCRATPAHS